MDIDAVVNPVSTNFVADRSRSLSISACTDTESMVLPEEVQFSPDFSTATVLAPSLISIRVGSLNPKSKIFLLRKSSSFLSKNLVEIGRGEFVNAFDRAGFGVIIVLGFAHFQLLHCRPDR